MPLVESPCVNNGNVHQIKPLKDNPQSFDGPLQRRRVGQIEGEALLLEKLGTGLGLSDSTLGQRDINPTSKKILLVPRRFAVTDQNQGVLHVHVTPFRGGAGRSGSTYQVQAVIIMSRSYQEIIGR